MDLFYTIADFSFALKISPKCHQCDFSNVIFFLSHFLMNKMEAYKNSTYNN